MFRRTWLIVLALILVLPVGAQEPEGYPTVERLEQATVPPRELVDLAMRLEGVTEFGAPLENPPTLEVGTVDTFWADNSAENRSFEVEAELRVVGEHIYLWVERGQEVDQADLETLAETFDVEIYEQVRALWGSEATPGVDGDPRVHGLFASDLGGSVAAYFAGKHAYPVEAVPTSNAREMFFYNLDAVSRLSVDTLASITAHEFQHMIRANVDSNEDGWLDEGFSEFTQLYLGETNAFAAVAFQQNPGTQLNTWTENGDRTADYGASGLWVTYLYERFGLDGINALSADPANGMTGVDNLAAEYETTADEIFADWVLANLVLDAADGPYGYESYASLPGPSVRGFGVGDLPLNETATINQYATNYFGISGLDGRETLTLTVEMPETVGLAPTESPSGTPMWYSNRGDDSNTYLTFALNLTDTENPVLTYDLWYHIENLWDYGYLMARPAGETQWDIIETGQMTTENPHFTAYGPGYTGRSGGGATSEWIRETVSLEQYAGQLINLRFEMIYDDAINQPGMLLDGLRAMDGDRVLYADDFGAPVQETAARPTGGWVLTDNRLPQRAWVQAVQQVGAENVIERWSHDGGQATYTLTLEPGVDNVVVAVSPFAPVTTTPTQVTLRVE